MNHKVRKLYTYKHTLLLIGIGTLLILDTNVLYAQNLPGASTPTYDPDRLILAVHTVLAYLEGPLGALIMVAAGLGAIASAAFGQYSAAISLFVVGVGSFVLRNFVELFFNIER